MSDYALSDVETALGHLFSGPEIESARAELRKISADSPGSTARIRLAALCVSRGNLQALVEAVELAALDPRDLLVAAEYSEQISLSGSSGDRLRQAQARDAARYRSWLDSVGLGHVRPVS